MRVIATVVVLATSCRFDPSGDPRLLVDAAEIADAAPRDAMPLDASPDAAVVIDGRPVDARPPCPTTYDVSSGGGRYVFRPIAMQHALAAADCADDLPGRTHLATFELVGLMDGAIDAVNPGMNATPWVGARCVGLDCNLTVSWVWTTLIPIDGTAWTALQPDNGATEKVARAEQDRADGIWRLTNVAATSTLPYICECDP